MSYQEYSVALVMQIQAKEGKFVYPDPPVSFTTGMECPIYKSSAACCKFMIRTKFVRLCAEKHEPFAWKFWELNEGA